MIVAVTGASGDIGSAIVRRLCSLGRIEEVVVLGRRRPPTGQDGVRYVAWELGQPWPAAKVGPADALIHSAFVIEDTAEQDEAFDANVTGTLRLVSTAANAGVGHITFVSSANAYGLKSGPTALAESDATTDAPKHFYLHHKYLCELAMRSFADVDGDTIYAIARPCMVVGPNMSNSALSTLATKVLFYPHPDHSSYQFIDVEDVADALTQIVSSRVGGTLNLAPDDSMTVREIAATAGHRAIHAPLWLARKASDLGFALGLTPFSSRWVTLGDPVMRSERSRAVLGWTASHSSRDALCGSAIVPT